MPGSWEKDIAHTDLRTVFKVCSQEINTHFTLKTNIFYAENQCEIIDTRNVIFVVEELLRITPHLNTPNDAVGHKGLGGLHM